MPPFILAETDVVNVIVGLVWAAFVGIGWIASLIKKNRERKADSEWETDVEWADEPSTDSREQSQSQSAAREATARQQAEAQAAEERAEREARARAIREREARIQAEEAERARREQEHAGSLALDPLGDANRQIAEALERQRRIAERQHAAAERAALALASQSATVPGAPDDYSGSVTSGRPANADGSRGKRKKSWVAQMSRRDLQRSVVMAEVFDRPRCFDT